MGKTRSRYGHTGTILRVDLSTSRIWTELTQNYVPKFLGGRGINQWILLKELPEWVTPFEPANILCFGAGTLTGTTVPGAARLNVDSKSAITPGIGSGNAGGWFAAELKYAGYDNIIIHGKADKPVYLWIEDEKIVLKSALDLWGQKTTETEEQIKDDLGNDNVQILCIGPAGENLVKSACIVVSGNRAVGRCGLGSIMGSKNLKAITVKGTGAVEIKELNEYKELVKTVSRRVSSLDGVKARGKIGTLAAIRAYNNMSAFPYRNYEDEHISEEHFKKISPDVFQSDFAEQRHGCSSCPAACGHSFRVESGPYSGTLCRKVEFVTVWDFGGKLGIEDPAAILKAQEVCWQLGLDIDTASSTIAWATECFQKKLFSLEDTDGLSLEWGAADVTIELLDRIAYRKGFGNILAEGSLRASKMMGRGTEKYAFHIKGQDLIEPLRSMKGWALGVVVSARGGTHTRGAPATEPRQLSKEVSQRLYGVESAGNASTYEGKPQVVTYFEYIQSIFDCLGVCTLLGEWANPCGGITAEELAKFYSLVTGNKLSKHEIMKAGERVHNVEKMFNVYHAGFTRTHDYPPRRFMEEPIKSGPLGGEVLDKNAWSRMLDEYYELHGWDRASGWPTKTKLEDLELFECTKILEDVEKKEAFRKGITEC